jgi:type IV secretory pathway VirD2 relaxase
MNTRDEDLTARLGRIRNRGGRYRGFFAEVHRFGKHQRSGKTHSLGSGPKRIASTFGRGRGAPLTLRSAPTSNSAPGAHAGAPRTGLFNSTRRVIVKARIVRHRKGGRRSAPLMAHIRYLKRDGVTKVREPARMFDRDAESTSERAFVERCGDDRHHFRFIVSPDDSNRMVNLRVFARELLADMEYDLGTKLDWIAVDHYNTDNPHLHILVRGKTDDGRDLVISREYISHGIRARAQDLVTLELGPRPEIEIRSGLERDVAGDRWTQLDAAIQREADEFGMVDLRPAEPFPRSQSTDSRLQGLMIGRLQRLEVMGLATNTGPSQWMLKHDAESTLRDLGVQNDIIKSMHEALSARGIDRAARRYIIHGPNTPRILGCLVEKGLHDELSGESYVIIDAVDGRAHYVRLPDAEAIELSPPTGGIVEIRRDGGGANQAGLALASRSDLPIEPQITARGATWLDRQLVSRERAVLSDAGFGHEVRQALEARIDHLAAEGLARRHGAGVTFAQKLVETLRQRDLVDAATELARRRPEFEYRPLAPGDSVTGVYRKRMDLTSGRFAMIEDGLGFSLVPWKPSLERHLGQHVSGVVRSETVDWNFGRKRGPSIS